MSNESAADRDAAFAKLKNESVAPERRGDLLSACSPTASNPDRWASRDQQDILFGVDCVQQIEEQWAQLLEQARKLVDLV